jgi:copper transport protein
MINSKGISRKLQLALFLPILILTPLVTISNAYAHASIMSSSPREGEVFDSSPASLSLEFTEVVKTDSEQIKVYGSNGMKVESEVKIFVNDARSMATIVPKNPMEDGSYTLSWIAESNDGHIVGGGINFAVGSKTMVSNAKPVSGGKYYISPLDRLAEGASWLGLIVLFSLIVLERKKWIRVVAVLGLIVNGARFWEFAEKFGRNPIGVGSVKAIALSFVVNLLVLILAGKISNIFIKRALVACVVLGFSLQALLQGHVLDLQDYYYLAIASLVIHLASAQVWMGSVVALSLDPTIERYKETRKRSTVAIMVLAISGSLVSILLLSPYKLTVYNAWQSLLAIKLLLLLVALGLGALHHFRFEKRVTKGENIKKSIYLEIVVMVMVLVATAWLVSYTPPRFKQSMNVSEVTEEKLMVKGLVFDDGSNGKIEIGRVKPGIPTKVMVTIVRADGGLFENKEIQVYASNSKMNIIDISALLTGELNHYMGEIKIPAKGSWQFKIQAMVDDFTMVQSIVNIEME